MVYTVMINNKEYEVEVERGKANILKTREISIQNTPAPSVAAARAPETAPVPAAPAAPAVQGGAEAVKAPMPGTILDIKVSQGARVKEGEILIILEAMKMENEVLAPRDGVVTQLFVSKGSSVSTGDSLVSIQ